MSETNLEEHLRWLASTVPGFSYRCRFDADWKMLLLTDGIEALTGYPASDFLNNTTRTYATVIHPDDREGVIGAVGLAVEHGETYYIDYRVVSRDGEIKWVSERGRATSDGAGVRWLDGYVVERTELQRMRSLDEERHEAVRRQQAALVTLVTAEVIGEGDLAGSCRLATELVADALGVARASVWLLDGHHDTLELVDLYEHHVQTHSAQISLSASQYPHYFAAMRTGRLIDAHDAMADPRTSEFAEGYLGPLGITSMLDVALRVSGGVVGVLCLEHVGPARRWLDHEIQFAGEVADQVAHALLNRARREAQERESQLQEQLILSQKMEAVGRLAGGIAHDFNNLLTVISGFAECVYDSVGPGVLQDDVHEIRLAAEQGAELTSQLLAVSRKEELQLAHVDVVACVRSLRNLLRRVLAAGVTLKFEETSEPLFVMASRGLIQQILTNLVVNAEYAMEGRGTITLSVELAVNHERMIVQGGALPPGRYAKLVVTDTGSGMSPAELKNIFEPFFTTKPEGAGTGLGLSTVYSIVSRCGGGIVVNSVPQRGTTMEVWLPVAEGHDETRTSDDGSSAAAQWDEALHVLVVEDNPSVLQVIERGITRAHVKVTAVAGPQDALALLADRANHFSLVLTDMGMPDGGGQVVIEWLRLNAPELPIGVISGYVSTGQADAAEGLPLLRKPFLAADLAGFVQTVLEEWCSGRVSDGLRQTEV